MFVQSVRSSYPPETVALKQCNKLRCVVHLQVSAYLYIAVHFYKFLRVAITYTSTCVKTYYVMSCRDAIIAFKRRVFETHPFSSSCPAVYRDTHRTIYGKRYTISVSRYAAIHDSARKKQYSRRL